MTPNSPSGSNDLSRREFNRKLFGTIAGIGLVGCSNTPSEPFVPALGCQSNLDNAVAIKNAGGSFIGLSVAGWLDPDGPEEEFLVKLEAAKASPIPVITCNSFIRRKDLHCTGPDANHKEVMEYCTRAFKRAQRAGVGMITFGSSGSRRLPPGFEYEKGMEQFIALLKVMGPVAQDHGVSVGVEQLRAEEVNFINHIAEVERIVREVDHPNIRGIADIYHMAKGGDTPEQLASAAELIQHIEIAEENGRRMPGVNGQDFRPYFKVMKEAGYKGAIGVEGKWNVSELPMGFKTLTQQWLEA